MHSRANPEELLRGKAFQLIFPTGLAGVVVVAVAAYYFTLTVALPPGTERTFYGLTAAVAATVIAWLSLRARARLAKTVALSRGALAPTEEHLADAAREVFGMPDALFVYVVHNWLVGGASLGLSFKLFCPEVSWAMSGRVFTLALIFGALNALLSQIVTTARTRTTLSELSACGLSLAKLSEVIPTRKLGLRGRLLIFTGISVFVPVALNVDVSASLAQRGFQRMVGLTSSAALETQAAALRGEIYVSVAILCALVVAVAMFAAWLVGNALGGPLREIADEAVAIADGKLAGSKVIPAEDEVWAVSVAFSAMQGHMREVIGQLKGAGQQIGETAGEIVSTSARHEAGAAEQAAALNQTSATTEELARSARQIADNAGAVSGLAQKTLEAAQEGQISADAFSQSMQRMQEDNRAIADAVVKLNKRVQQIGKIVAFINGVADKSDLLALNAELEGTKAGEVGRGFSLVAGEMRRLAENVLESTKEIEGLIEEIREATQAAVAATQSGVGATTEGSRLAAELAHHLAEIVRLAGETSDAVRAISLATQQQQSGTDQLADAMADILRVTQEGLMSNRQVNAANVDLTALATELKQAVERFEVA